MNLPSCIHLPHMIKSPAFFVKYRCFLVNRWEYYFLPNSSNLLIVWKISSFSFTLSTIASQFHIASLIASSTSVFINSLYSLCNCDGCKMCICIVIWNPWCTKSPMIWYQITQGIPNHNDTRASTTMYIFSENLLTTDSQ